MVSARRCFTANATSCCCAPSWMFRSRAFARTSCAATMRRRDSRRSSISRTLRSTRPGLCSDVGHQAFTIGSQGFGRRRHDADRAQQFAAVTDGERPLPVGEHREVLIGTAPAKDRRRRRAVGPGRRGPELRSHGQPHGRTLRADPLGQHTDQARQHVVGGIGLARTLGEACEHLVRGRALAVDHAVGQPSSALTHRLEGHGHHGGRHRGEQRTPIVADQRADADDEPDVDDRDERRQHREHDGPADHDVDVVQPVLQHRDRDRRVEEEEREGREHLARP